MDETKAILKEQYEKLPADVQKAILSEDLQNKLTSISQKHNLPYDHADALETETVLVMLGLEAPADYAGNLENTLDIPQEELGELLLDVEALIFAPIMDSLIAFFEKELGGVGNTTSNQAPLPKTGQITEIPKTEPQRKVATSEVPQSADEVDIFQKKLSAHTQSEHSEIAFQEREGNLPPTNDPYRESTG